MRVLLIISLIWISSETFCQTISRQVISSTGLTGGQLISSSSVGPSILGTSNSSNGTLLTQGFQQPSNEALFVEIVTTEPLCDSPESGSIELIITGCTGIYDILWNTGSEEEIIENLTQGVYSVTVSSGNCEWSQNITLELDPNCEVDIPNLISVNQDGDNDFWIIPQLFYPENAGSEVRIFNRWGQEVWFSNTYDNTNVYWDGKLNNGEELSAGTYFFEIKFPQEIKTGFIELLR